MQLTFPFVLNKLIHSFFVYVSLCVYRSQDELCGVGSLSFNLHVGLDSGCQAYTASAFTLSHLSVPFDFSFLFLFLDRASLCSSGWP